MSRSSMGDGRPPMFSAGRLSSRPKGRRSMVSFHNRGIVRRNNGEGWCERERRWEVCNYPKCGVESKENCSYLHGYKHNPDMDTSSGAYDKEEE